MKIRIRGASLRMRLSRSEVAQLVHDGLVAEETPFDNAVFHYAVQRVPDGTALSAMLAGSSITMQVPQTLIVDWDVNNLVTIDAHMPLAGGGALYLLLEKDFQCIDVPAGEDQSDNYINPNQTC